MTDKRYRETCAVHLEILKLRNLNHPRIQVSLAPKLVLTSIDAWCDGDETEAQQVLTTTKRLRRLNDSLEKA
jgi:hypothetical protein